MDALKLANYIIKCYEAANAPISNLKLQKVLYYVQGYFNKAFSKNAFDEDIVNWQFGPVIPKVYYCYRSYYATLLSSNPDIDDPILSSSEKKLIKQIVEVSRHISPSRLVSMTHEEEPWKNTKRNAVIDQDAIKSYFRTSNPLEIII